MIVSNQVECLRCGDRPYSAHVYDFKSCRCGAISVDGGQHYLRRVGDLSAYKDISIKMPKAAVDASTRAVEEAISTGRNAYEIALAVFRALRDSGYDLNRAEAEELEGGDDQV